MSKYLYWPVSGAGYFWKEPRSLKEAKAALPKLREKWLKVEIERVLLLNNNARRYWRWRSGKWSTEKHYDPTAADLAHFATPAPE